jgi:hypothetical protein
MARVRAFGPEHVADVARLHRAVFRPQDPETPVVFDAYRDYLTSVFLTSPLSDPSLPSLVCEDADGRAIGFIGVSSRTIVIGGRRLRAAVSSQFVVDPAGPAGLVAVRLEKTFLDGAQDLSITDNANDASRGIWERLGGQTDRWLSLHWTRPLRPAGLLLSMAAQRPAWAPLAWLARPLAAVADAVVTRAEGSGFRQTGPSTTSAELETTQILADEPKFRQSTSLSVEHDEPGMSWLLSRAVRPQAGGRLRKVRVEQNGRLLGWYIWHLDRHGTADVLELAATNDTVGDVLDQLFFEAWRDGAIAVTGRLDSQFVQALSDKHCLIHRRGPWTLIHARRGDLLQPFWTGSASFSRLDGEWSLAF